MREDLRRQDFFVAVTCIEGLGAVNNFRSRTKDTKEFKITSRPVRELAYTKERCVAYACGSK